MKKQRRKKISFIAKKKFKKPVRVEFYTKNGKRISFEVYRETTKPIRIEFYVKKEKKEKTKKSR